MSLESSLRTTRERSRLLSDGGSPIRGNQDPISPGDLELRQFFVGPSPVKAGEEVHADVDLHCVRDDPCPEVDVEWFVNGERVRTMPVDFTAVSSDSINVSLRTDDLFTNPGDYTVEAQVPGDSASGSVTVEGAGPDLNVVGLRVDKSQVQPGETYTLELTVKNTGGESGQEFFDISIDGNVLGSFDATVPPGETRTFTSQEKFARGISAALGEHTIEVGGQTVTVTVVEEKDSGPGGQVEGTVADGLQIERCSVPNVREDESISAELEFCCSREGGCDIGTVEFRIDGVSLPNNVARDSVGQLANHRCLTTPIRVDPAARFTPPPGTYTARWVALSDGSTICETTFEVEPAPEPQPEPQPEPEPEPDISEPFVEMDCDTPASGSTRRGTGTNITTRVRLRNKDPRDSRAVRYEVAVGGTVVGSRRVTLTAGESTVDRRTFEVPADVTSETTTLPVQVREITGPQSFQCGELVVEPEPVPSPGDLPGPEPQPEPEPDEDEQPSIGDRLSGVDPAAAAAGVAVVLLGILAS